MKQVRKSLQVAGPPLIVVLTGNLINAIFAQLHIDISSDLVLSFLMVSYAAYSGVAHYLKELHNDHKNRWTDK
jgi:hypothetical protein